MASRKSGKGPRPGAAFRSEPGAVIRLRPGREKPVLQRHPWLFSGAVQSIGSSLRDGDVGPVESADGKTLGFAYVNRASQIVGRMLSFDPSIPVDDAFVGGRVERAVRARGAKIATRLINAESDGLPGLVVDRYGDFAVLQSSTLGMDRLKETVLRALLRAVPLRGVWERSDVDGREKEGVASLTGLLSGEAPPELVRVEEAGRDRPVILLVDVRRGHKTGAYLDQADNRRLLTEGVAGAELLNLFSYTGAFGIHAALAGARAIVNVDSSADALALSERTARENGVAEQTHHERADCFEILRRFRAEGRSFDGVIVDPPKLVHSSQEIDRGARAYKDLFRIALQITRPGGWVALFSCSGLVSLDLFQKIAWSASLEAGREARIVRRLGQAPDHPILLSFPEGEYLKGLLCRVA